MSKARVAICILSLLVFQSTIAFAQTDNPPIPSAPSGGNVVLDILGWLTASQESEINSINKKLDEEGIAQISVVTLDDCGDDKQKFRNDLFRTWGIGHANDNDGLLILVCWYGGDESKRSVEQETGYGLEGTLPDILTQRIVNDEFIPAFKSNQPGEGLVAMVKRYDELLRQSPDHPNPVPLSKPQTPNRILEYLTVGILGILPGLVFSSAYTKYWKLDQKPPTTNKLRMRARNKNKIWGFRIPEWRQFSLAEIFALIPILAIMGGILFNIPRVYNIPQGIKESIGVIFTPLLFWLFLLIFLYFSDTYKYGGKGYQDSDSNRWDSIRDDSRSGSDIFSRDSFGGNDSSGDNFGGGSSGGGGSSTKF